MELRLRVATPADLAAVDSVLAASYPTLLKPDYPPSVLVAVVPLISRARPELLDSGSYYLAETGGVVVGVGGWTHARPTGAPSTSMLGHVRHVATHPSAVRQGVGRALMGHILTQAKAAGMRRLECLATLTAVPFYQSMGFVRDQTINVAIGPAKIDFQSVRMFADL